MNHGPAANPQIVHFIAPVNNNFCRGELKNTFYLYFLTLDIDFADPNRLLFCRSYQISIVRSLCGLYLLIKEIKYLTNI